MRGQRKTEDQLLSNLKALQERNDELEALASNYKGVQEAFEKSETLLRKVFETIPDLFAVIDRDHRILFSNWHGGYEYVPEEVRSGHPLCYETFYNGQAPCEPCHVLEVFKTGKPVVLEKLNPRIGQVEVRAYPVFDESGNVAMVAENIRDITERKRTETELRQCRGRLEELVKERTVELNHTNDALKREIAEREQAGAALREQLHFLQQLLDSIPTPVFYRDIHGIYLGCNTAFERFVDLSKDHIVGKTVYELFPKELADSCHEVDSILSHQPGVQVYETSMVRADGAKRDVIFNSATYVDADGKVAGIVVAVVDVTQRKSAENALRKSEERYALAVRGTNDGIWDTDLINGEVYFSPRWKSMLGYEENEISNELAEWMKMIHPDDCRMVMDARKDYLEGGTPAYEVEYRLRHKDGGYRWVLSRGACLRDPQGKPYRFSGSHTDITERKTMEHAIRESEKKYRTLFEESKDVVFIVDAAGRMIDINPAGTELFGYIKEELLAMSHTRDLGISPTIGEVIMKTLASSGFVKNFELELQRKDGEKSVVHLSATVMRDDGGKIIGYQGIAHDVTERKRLEQQLMQAQKMESIGILAGGVAHDFNNLITAISGYGETIRDSVSANDELLQDSVEQVLKAAERAADLTRSLLAFSRKQVIHPKPVLIDTVIRNASKLIKRIIGEDIVLSTSFSDKKLPAMADTGQIEQVMMNLATNARDAMPHGGCLDISTTETVVPEGAEAQYDVAMPGRYVRISVTDTGTGIDEKSLDRIFEPFFTTKEAGKGTGLGLAVTYGIIKQHNGSIHVKSEPGKGTAFSIYLPILENDPAGKEKPSAVASSTFCGTETLLIAEDEEMVRTFMKKIFERAGYKVMEAGDGEDAIEKFRENMEDISLVLSDVIMPRKNGREILDEVRKMKPGIKVIFISGYTANIMHEKGIFEEGLDFIAKPFVKDELLRKVREVLDKS
jgi:two-component system cell cycle sensor histidine kinase/response regulator CckA